MHRTGKDKLGAGSLSPQPINQVPIVTPMKEPVKSPGSAQQALSTDPGDRQPFLPSPVTRQEDELPSASV